MSRAWVRIEALPIVSPTRYFIQVGGDGEGDGVKIHTLDNELAPI